MHDHDLELPWPRRVWIRPAGCVRTVKVHRRRLLHDFHLQHTESVRVHTVGQVTVLSCHWVSLGGLRLQLVLLVLLLFLFRLPPRLSPRLPFLLLLPPLLLHLLPRV